MVAERTIEPSITDVPNKLQDCCSILGNLTAACWMDHCYHNLKKAYGALVHCTKSLTKEIDTIYYTQMELVSGFLAQMTKGLEQELMLMTKAAFFSKFASLC